MTTRSDPADATAALPTALLRRGLIGDLDCHFSRFILRLHDAERAPSGRTAAAERRALLLATLLLSSETGAGNVCVDLPARAGRTLFDASSFDASELRKLTAPRWPGWAALLRRSPTVGRPGDFQPLILDDRGRLYLYRYWDYETRLAADLNRRAGAAAPVAPAALRAGLARLFAVEAEAGGAPDWQQIAAATAALRRLCVISGGPGTGKTTTVVRILALLLEQDDTLRIALAAPTGKAAARLQQALQQAKRTLPIDPQRRALIPQQASTLHRLLGARPASAYFRHDRERPLPLDLLVVDEASMIDLALMTKLLDALSPTARLILLGDKDQLASVEAGAVLGDICGPAAAHGDSMLCSPRQRQTLQRLVDGALPETADDGARPRPALADSVVLLRRSYRFSADGGIGALARAINRGDAAAAFALLRAGDGVGWRHVGDAADLQRRLDDSAVAGYRQYLELIDNDADADAVFAAFNRFRVLTALRHGRYGTLDCNRAIETLLRRRGLLQGRGPWYRGRPVMITHNDHNLQLYNGDVGIAVPDRRHRNRLRVQFDTAGGGRDAAARALSPARLPPHETVFAMTVHKSQGSEFDHVALLLPPQQARVLSRELLYTAVTRARRRAEIWGTETVFDNAVGRRLHRTTGLRDALWGVDNDPAEPADASFSPSDPSSLRAEAAG